jgi:hypothetical protein
MRGKLGEVEVKFKVKVKVEVKVSSAQGLRLGGRVGS